MGDPQKAVLLAAGFGLVFFVQGIRIRAGISRGWQRLYWNRNLPVYYRNASLTFLPISLLIVVALVGVALDSVGLVPWGAWVTLLALVGFITIVPYFMFRPPTWLKPKWLREEEARIEADPSRQMRLATGSGETLSARDYRLGVALLIIAIAAWIIFAWPPVVLLGLGLGGGLLYARRPRS